MSGETDRHPKPEGLESSVALGPLAAYYRQSFDPITKAREIGDRIQRVRLELELIAKRCDLGTDGFISVIATL